MGGPISMAVTVTAHPQHCTDEAMLLPVVRAGPTGYHGMFERLLGMVYSLEMAWGCFGLVCTQCDRRRQGSQGNNSREIPHPWRELVLMLHLPLCFLPSSSAGKENGPLSPIPSWVSPLFHISHIQAPLYVRLYCWEHAWVCEGLWVSLNHIFSIKLLSDEIAIDLWLTSLVLASPVFR